MTLTQGVGDLVTAGADLCQRMGADTVLFEEGGGAGGGLDPRLF